MISFLLVSFVTLLNLFWIVFLQKKIKVMKLLEKNTWIKVESNRVTKKILIMWIEKGISNEEIINYFHKHGISCISIYGMTELGILLYNTLKESDITVVNGIDRGGKILNLPINIFKPEEFPGSVDAVVVTSIYYFSEIYDTLCQKIENNVPIIGLDEILFDISIKK